MLTSTHATFDKDNFHELCDLLAKKDKDLEKIIAAAGYPPLWSREPGFATLVHIILEQQVSLSSAKAALNKLEDRIGIVTPARLLSLTDEEMKACYFSRQKTRYARHLAELVLAMQLDLNALETKEDGIVKEILKKVTGIGDWTADVYLMMALHRTDCFPLGDVALISSLKKTKNLSQQISREQLDAIAVAWKPYRTVAAFLLWHAYLTEKNPQVLK